MMGCSRTPVTLFDSGPREGLTSTCKVHERSSALVHQCHVNLCKNSEKRMGKFTAWFNRVG